MPRGIKKENLPIKDCVICLRSFNWRKKWERCWDEVTTCSKSCNAKRRGLSQSMKTHAADSENTSDCSVEALLQNTIDLADIEAVSTGFSDLADIEAVRTGTSINTHRNESLDLLKVEEVAQVDPQFDDETDEVKYVDGLEFDSRSVKKAVKKLAKKEKRLKREGKADPCISQRPCNICSKQVDLLIRCQVDARREWKMVCGKCWHGVSGGVTDGDPDHPYYRYGGLWKSK